MAILKTFISSFKLRLILLLALGWCVGIVGFTCLVKTPIQVVLSQASHLPPGDIYAHASLMHPELLGEGKAQETFFQLPGLNHWLSLFQGGLLATSGTWFSIIFWLCLAFCLGGILAVLQPGEEKISFFQASAKHFIFNIFCSLWHLLGFYLLYQLFFVTAQEWVTRWDFHKESMMLFFRYGFFLLFILFALYWKTTMAFFRVGGVGGHPRGIRLFVKALFLGLRWYPHTFLLWFLLAGLSGLVMALSFSLLPYPWNLAGLPFIVWFYLVWWKGIQHLGKEHLCS